MYLIDIFMYLLLLLLIIFASYMEFSDLNRIKYSYPKTNDEYADLLKNIKSKAKIASSLITWRKSFLLAVIISIFIFLVLFTPSTLPRWNTFYMCLAIVFVILYISDNIYSFHAYKYPEECIIKDVDLIKRKCL